MVLAMTSEALATGVRIAIPFIAILFMTQIALAFISRAAPAMQIFSIGFAVTMATGALVMVLVLPDLGYELLGEVSRSGGKIETLLAALDHAVAKAGRWPRLKQTLAGALVSLIDGRIRIEAAPRRRRTN